MQSTTAFKTAPLSAKRRRRDEIVLEHLVLVRYIARRIHCHLPPQVLLEDLVHTGVLGLLDAIHKYNPRKNVALKAYAGFRIRGAILDSLREDDWSPRALRRKARRLDEAISKCESRLGRRPTEQELASELQIKLVDLQRLLTDLNGLELENFGAEPREANGGGAAATFGALLPRDGDPFCYTLRAEIFRLVIKAIEELSERERKILKLHHFDELPLKAVGLALGIGESRVSQIHSAALLRLRTQLTGLLGRSPIAC